MHRKMVEASKLTYLSCNTLTMFCCERIYGPLSVIFKYITKYCEAESLCCTPDILDLLILTEILYPLTHSTKSLNTHLDLDTLNQLHFCDSGFLQILHIEIIQKIFFALPFSLSLTPSNLPSCKL